MSSNIIKAYGPINSPAYNAGGSSKRWDPNPVEEKIAAAARQSLKSSRSEPKDGGLNILISFSQKLIMGEWDELLPKQSGNHKQSLKIAAQAHAKGLLSDELFMTFNSIIAAHDCLLEFPQYLTEIEVSSDCTKDTVSNFLHRMHDDTIISWHLFNSKLVIERPVPKPIRTLVYSSTDFMLKAERVIDNNGITHYPAMEKLVHYFGLDYMEERKFRVKIASNNIPRGEKTIFTMRLPVRFQEISPMLSKLSRHLTSYNGRRTFRPVKNIFLSKVLEKYTEFIIPSATIFRLIHEIRNPNVAETSCKDFPVYTGNKIKSGNEYAGKDCVGGPYAQILYYQLKSLHKEFNLVSLLGTRNSRSETFRIPTQQLSEVKTEAKSTGYDQLMRFRPKHAAQLSDRSDHDLASLFANSINRGDYFLVGYSILKNMSTRFEQTILINNLLLALREGMISIEQFATVNTVIAAYEGLINNPQIVKHYAAKNESWSKQQWLNFVNTSNPDQKTVQGAFEGKITTLTLKEPLHPLIREMRRNVPSNYPRAVSLLTAEGDIDESAFRDIIHFYGITNLEVDRWIRDQILKAKMPLSEKTLFRIRAPVGLYEFSPLIWAQKHKIKVHGNLVFCPFRRRDDEGLTELIIPSASIHRLVLESINMHPHPPAYFMPPEGAKFLPVDLFEEMHEGMCRPVQLYWPPHCKEEPIAIDTRITSSHLSTTIHDLWHTIQDSVITKEGHQMRDLIVRKFPEDEVRNNLLDGEILYPNFDIDMPRMDAARFYTWVMEKLIPEKGWEEEHTDALVQGMVELEKEWTAKLGFCWRNLPPTSQLYLLCAEKGLA